MAKLWKLVAIAVLLAACKGKKQDTVPKHAATSTEIPNVDPTLCDTAGKNVVTSDLNNDNKPDVWRLYKAEDEGGTTIEFMTCKQVDFNGDGQKDWVVAYNRKGNPIFEKRDIDYDGKFEMSATYDAKTGHYAEIDRDMDGDGRYEVKELYDSRGMLTSVRRDRNGDGQPDQWEQYKDTILIAILYDDDYDGRVDRREEIPGATPKIEMPTTMDPIATGTFGGPDKAPAPAPPATKGGGKK
jgi:hypothetical protein